MTLVAIPNLFLIASQPVSSGVGPATLNASGESAAGIGQIYLEGGTGSKTISSSGGKIYWVSAGLTIFAAAGTLLRVGIQDVDLGTGMEDGSYDVFKELVAGTDAIAANSAICTVMDTGTKTINHGDLVAIVFEMTVRVSPDSVLVGRGQALGEANSVGMGWGFPYGTADTGTLAIAQQIACAVIEFDDGTIGWISNAGGLLKAADIISFNVDSTPDEYCGVFMTPIKMEISSIGWELNDIDPGDAFELILYQDPSTSPSILATVVPDPECYAAAGLTEGRGMYMITPVTLEVGVEYGVAIRPTTTNSISTSFVNITTTDVILSKKMLPFGASTLMMARTGNSGPFSTVQTYHIPRFYLGISKLDDGQSSGGGGLKLTGAGGLAG